MCPLKSQGEVIGVLGLASCKESAFGEAEARLLQSIGHHVGIAVEKAMLFRDLTRSNRELATLQDVSEALTSTLDLGEVMSRAFDGLRTRLHGTTPQLCGATPD